ncbi:MAG: A/G-specific adenine glycosylase [Alphaproteobacteria bacterium]
MPRPADQPHADSAALVGDLLAWYDRHRRTLPWRAPPGGRADPYRVWLSEIMLQQTTVAAVGGYFRDFVARWPGVRDLAAATLDDVLHGWAGLGYYARARNLHRCARAVVERYGGHFPEDEGELRQLPGIGAYTAAAIAAIAFDRPAVVVDGNVERVVARLRGVTDPLPPAKPALRALAAGLSPAERPGDHAQAMMDLGATVCTPRRPRCTVCPWSAACVARRAGIAESLPARLAKAERPTRRGVAFWTLGPAGQVLLRRRPDRGLLGGMIEVPSSPWREAAAPDLAAVLADAPAPARWRLLPGLVRHTFTHFHLELAVAAGLVARPDGIAGLWVAPDAIGDHALPTVMKKVVRHALGACPSNAYGQHRVFKGLG